MRGPDGRWVVPRLSMRRAVSETLDAVSVASDTRPVLSDDFVVFDVEGTSNDPTAAELRVSAWTAGDLLILYLLILYGGARTMIIGSGSHLVV